MTAPAAALEAPLAVYWDAVEHNDAAGALATVDATLAEGHRLGDVLDQLVAATQRRVGELWLEGEWSVAREHAATAVSEYVVRALLARHTPRHATEDHRQRPALLVACAEREWHALPGLVISTLVAAAGHPVRFLGSDVSTRTLQGALLDVPARALLVSASLTSSLVYVRRHVETASHAGVPTVVGGHGLDAAGARARALGATAQARGADDVLDVVAALPRWVPEVPPLVGAAAAEAQQLAARVSAVARAALGRMAPRLEGVDPHVVDVLDDQLPVVVGCVVSALLVDDPDLITESRGWLGRVLTTRGADTTLLDDVHTALAHELRDHPAALRLLQQSGRTGPTTRALPPRPRRG